jgi:hypothetical protein
MGGLAVALQVAHGTDEALRSWHTLLCFGVWVLAADVTARARYRRVAERVRETALDGPYDDLIRAAWEDWERHGAVRADAAGVGPIGVEVPVVFPIVSGLAGDMCELLIAAVVAGLCARRAMLAPLESEKLL